MASSVTIAVDGSGSMNGFFKAGGLQEYVVDLRQRVSDFADCKLVSFVDEEMTTFQTNPKKWGQRTLLDSAFENLSRSSVEMAVIITDNLQDTDQDRINTLAFYEQLNRPAVVELHILPKLLSFDGKIYNAMFNNRNVRYYNGKRGLLIYLIRFSKSADNFRRLLSILGSQTMRIKPITKRDINVIGVDQGDLGRVVGAVDFYKKKCGETQTYGNVIPRPNAKISENGLLGPFKSEPDQKFRFNQKNNLKFYFGLASKLAYIDIGNSLKPCSKEIGLQIENLQMRIRDYGGRIKEKSAEVIPKTLVGALASNQPSPYYYFTKVTFTPRLDWNPVNFYKNIHWDWSRFRLKKHPLELRFNILVTVPPTFLTLTERYRKKYFTKSSDDLKRIYSPQDIVQVINRQSVKIRLRVTNRRTKGERS